MMKFKIKIDLTANFAQKLEMSMLLNIILLQGRGKSGARKQNCTVDFEILPPNGMKIPIFLSGLSLKDFFAPSILNPYPIPVLITHDLHLQV